MSKIIDTQAGVQYVLTRDGGEPIMTGTDLEIMRYIHQNHSYSMDHALRYEGYAVTEAPQHVTITPLDVAGAYLNAVNPTGDDELRWEIRCDGIDHGHDPVLLNAGNQYTDANRHIAELVIVRHNAEYAKAL